MKYDIILTDIDNTLLDFSADARCALKTTLEEWGLTFCDEDWHSFNNINDALWRDFEQGKIQKMTIFPERARRIMEIKGAQGDPCDFSRAYTENLAKGDHQYPDSRRLLETLRSMGCKIIGVTNGTTSVQTARMTRSGLRPLFDGMYISEQFGVQKPNKEFYDLVFGDIGEDKRQRAIMLGDSLTSDMQGGRNAGIATCFFGDPDKADHRCDYIITELMQFVDVVK